MNLKRRNVISSMPWELVRRSGIWSNKAKDRDGKGVVWDCLETKPVMEKYVLKQKGRDGPSYLANSVCENWRLSDRRKDNGWTCYIN